MSTPVGAFHRVVFRTAAELQTAQARLLSSLGQLQGLPDSDRVVFSVAPPSGRESHVMYASTGGALLMHKLGISGGGPPEGPIPTRNLPSGLALFIGDQSDLDGPPE